ncbi:hypothetical protein PG985_000636 [Apiospora marii]|uniref:Uncharacterized protein n=1 Tax=Apiospora marii TaxID=335849 RepID=A0ABR1R2P8_9PEZI
MYVSRLMHMNERKGGGQIPMAFSQFAVMPRESATRGAIDTKKTKGGKREQLGKDQWPTHTHQPTISMHGASGARQAALRIMNKLSQAVHTDPAGLRGYNGLSSPPMADRFRPRATMGPPTACHPRTSHESWEAGLAIGRQIIPSAVNSMSNVGNRKWGEARPATTLTYC